MDGLRTAEFIGSEALILTKWLGYFRMVFDCTIQHGRQTHLNLDLIFFVAISPAEDSG